MGAKRFLRYFSTGIFALGIAISAAYLAFRKLHTRCWAQSRIMLFQSVTFGVLFLVTLVGSGLAGYLRRHSHLNEQCPDPEYHSHRRKNWRDEGWNLGLPVLSSEPPPKAQ